MTLFVFSLLFRNAWFWNKKLDNSTDLGQKILQRVIFKLKILKDVGIRKKNWFQKTACELRQNWVETELENFKFFVHKFYNASEFELKP